MFLFIDLLYFIFHDYFASMNVPPFHVDVKQKMIFLQLKKSCRFVRCRFDSGFGDLVKKFSSSVNGIAMCAAICNEAAIESHATAVEFAISRMWIAISKSTI